MTAVDFSCPCGFRFQPKTPPAAVPTCPDCRVPLEPYTPAAWILASRRTPSPAEKGTAHAC